MWETLIQKQWQHNQLLEVSLLFNKQDNQYNKESLITNLLNLFIERTSIEQKFSYIFIGFFLPQKGGQYFQLFLFKSLALICHYNFQNMRNKKLTINLVSHLAQIILQHRIDPSKQFLSNITKISQKIQNMHYENNYHLDSYFRSIEHQQYDIEKRLNLKSNKILLNGSLCIKFKVIEKQKFSLEHLQTWIISYSKLQIQERNQLPNYNQELINLLQIILRSLKCQFLFSELIMSQQLKKKFIVDYQIQFNPSKKYLRKVSALDYQKVWRKEAKVDSFNNITVTCYHNESQKIKSIINKQHQLKLEDINEIAFTDTIPMKAKRGSEETHACTSGEFQCSDTHIFQCFDVQNQGRYRKNSVIQFFDQELNITVLSNDSDSFKKSTGKISGVYGQQYREDQQSEDEFQIMIQQSKQEQLLKYERQKSIQLNSQLYSLLESSQNIFYQLDDLLTQYFD